MEARNTSFGLPTRPTRPNRFRKFFQTTAATGHCGVPIPAISTIFWAGFSLNPFGSQCPGDLLNLACICQGHSLSVGALKKKRCFLKRIQYKQLPNKQEREHSVVFGRPNHHHVPATTGGSREAVLLTLPTVRSVAYRGLAPPHLARLDQTADAPPNLDLFECISI